jgi:hypothetical protein
MLRLMNQTAGFMLYSALAVPSLFAAAKEPEKPDREMLRMIDFLRQMEMLQQMEMMRDMHEADHAAEPPPNVPARKTPPAKRKEISK